MPTKRVGFKSLTKNASLTDWYDMRLVFFIFILLIHTAHAQVASVFDRNCETHARKNKFLGPNSVLDADKSTERFFIYDNLTPAYGKMVDEVNKFAPGYYKTPERAPIQACPGVALEHCLPFRAYCTETIAKVAVREDLAKWKVVATNCQNPKYRAKNPPIHCQHDALEQLQYVYDQTMRLAQHEARKNPDAARFFREAAKEFSKYRDNLKALLAEQKKIEDQRKEEQRQKQLQKELAQSMKNCADVVASDNDDVENRNIAGKIVSGLGCQDDLASLNQSQIKELKEDIDNILEHMNTKVVLGQTNAIALEKTATAYWAGKKQLQGINIDSEQKALELACAENPSLCRDPHSKKTLANSFKKSQAKLKQISPLSEDETQQLLQKEFNPLVKEVNALCRQANSEWQKIQAENALIRMEQERKNYGKASIDNTRVVHPDATRYEQTPLMPRADESLLQAAHVSIQNKFSQLLNSKLGHLMMSESLQEKVGIFNPENLKKHCAGGSGQLLKAASASDMKQAKEDFAVLLEDELEKVSDAHQVESAHGRKKALQTYLKNNPLTIVELLKQNPSPEYAKLMCYLIRDINSSDENWQYFKTGVAVVGTVASIALGATGVGAPAGAALFAAVTMTTVVSATASLDDYFTAKNAAQMSRQAGATNQDSKTGALITASQQEDKADESFKEFATTVTLEAAGFAGGKLLKVVKGPKNPAAITHAADDIINSSDDVIKATDNIVVKTSDDVIVPQVKPPRAPATVVKETPVKKVELEDATFEKVKVKQKNAPWSANKRLDKDKLKESEKRYYDFIENNEPVINREIIKPKSTAMERLGEMYGNSNPKDVEYLIKSEKVVKKLTDGGEATVYVNPKNNREALKIWHANRSGDFEESTRAVLHFEQRVAQNKKMAEVFTVSKIKEQGKNYIVKEFFPHSTEIGKVKHLPEVQAALKKLKSEALHSSDVLGQRLYQNLVKYSDNIHWDPDSKKIVLIDALGF